MLHILTENQPGIVKYYVFQSLLTILRLLNPFRTELLTKFLRGSNRGKSPLHQRLRIQGLESLELRRIIRIDVLFTYKIMFGLVDLNRSDFSN